MTDEAGATTPTDGPAAASAPAGSEQATPTNPSVQADAAPENAENQAKPEGGADTGNEAESGDEATGSTKLSRAQRLQRKAARLATMLAEREAELETLRSKAAQSGNPAGLTEPKEADYNGDFTAYLADRAAWKAAQAISEKLDARDKLSANEKAAAARREAVEEFQERAEEVKGRIPDFDATFETFAKAGGSFAPHVIEELHESEHGPILAYQLAKNPQLAAQLNAMSPRDAAREIGRLEAKVSLPNPRTKTSAQPPLKTPTGGASPPSDLGALAKKSDDATAYWNARQAQMKARA